MGTIIFVTEKNITHINSMYELKRQLPKMKFLHYDSVQKLIKNCKRVNPDLVIIETEKNFFRAKDYYCNNDTKIALCLSEINQNLLQELITFGFDGLLLKGLPSSETAAAINKILAGEYYVHPKVLEMIFTNNFPYDVNKILVNS